MYLGKIHTEMGNSLKGKELLEKAYLLFKEHYGKENPETGKSLMYLGRAYQGLKNLEEASKCYKEAYHIFASGKMLQAAKVKAWMEELT